MSGMEPRAARRRAHPAHDRGSGEAAERCPPAPLVPDPPARPPDRAAGPPPRDAWPEDDLVLISALQHWSYCPRRCALIHLEQTFEENLFTLRGRRLHLLVHQGDVVVEDGVRVVRGMPLWSARLGLTGQADVVEFHGETPYPVEYKSGRRRTWGHEALQLCAQALCLEEMLGVAVPKGAIYYHGSRARREVTFDEELRALVPEAVAAVRAMLAGTSLPPAPDDARCPNCSLFDACLPALAANPARIRGFQAELYHFADE